MESYRGIIENVILNGKHGPYAVVRVERVGQITFSLDKIVWQEGGIPEEGTEVLLSDVRKKRAGWRAMSVRFVRPSDSSN